MTPGPLFIRGKRLLLLYFCISIVATLVFFRVFTRIIRSNNLIRGEKQGNSKKRDIPKASPDFTFRHGSKVSFRNRPIITEMQCEGQSAYNRICKFKNLCFSPTTDRFFALTVDTNGLKKRWMNVDDNRLLDLTTVDDHNIFYFEFEEDPATALKELESYDMMYSVVTKKTFMFSRFVYNNIMHNIHDDFLGQYILHKKHSYDQGAIDTDNYIFFSDKLIENPNDHLFATLSKYPFIYREALKTYQADLPMCFENLVVGNSKDGIWYDYGFYDDPQGPISKKQLSGKYVKEAAIFLKKYYNVQLDDNRVCKNLINKMIHHKGRGKKHVSDHFYVSIFSRMQDRLLLNEMEIMKELEQRFGLMVRIVQLEVLAFNEIIEIMSSTIVSIGLHGSALIYTMFMPSNSVLLELFPYAVPGENYTPYRTLAWLPDIDLNYKMWINHNATCNYSQVGSRKKIDNLTPEAFLNIISLKTVPPHLCCGNLPWTVRIYQDTVVNIQEITKVIEDALVENLDVIKHPQKRSKYIKNLLDMATHKIFAVNHFINKQAFAGSKTVTMFRLELYWENPWKKLSKDPSQYGVWIEEFQEEILVTDPRLVIETCSEGSEINVWIRPYYLDKSSKTNQPATVYSRKFSFRCEM